VNCSSVRRPLRTVGVAPSDKRGRFEAAFSVRSGRCCTLGREGAEEASK
jgi:hypothetical protein